MSIIINVLVLSKLYYCASVRGNTSKKNLDKLQKIQNFAARILSGTKKFQHIILILKELNWFPVHPNVKLRESVMTFKCVKSLAPSYLCDKFVKRSDIHSNETRNKDKLQISMFKSSSGQRTFHYRAVTSCNSMSEDLRKCESVDNFKKKLQVLLFDQF